MAHSGIGDGWSKRPYYSCEFCREAVSAASGKMLINADFRFHIRSTDSETSYKDFLCDSSIH